MREPFSCPRCNQSVWRARDGRLYEPDSARHHWCGPGSPQFERIIRQLRAELDAARELLTECRDCGAEVVRQACSPVLYDPISREVHDCARPRQRRPEPPRPTRTPAAPANGRRPATW